MDITSSTIIEQITQCSTTTATILSIYVAGNIPLIFNSCSTYLSCLAKSNRARADIIPGMNYFMFVRLSWRLDVDFLAQSWAPIMVRLFRMVICRMFGMKCPIDRSGRNSTGFGSIHLELSFVSLLWRFMWISKKNHSKPHEECLKWPTHPIHSVVQCQWCTWVKHVSQSPQIWYSRKETELNKRNRNGI